MTPKEVPAMAKGGLRSILTLIGFALLVTPAFGDATLSFYLVGVERVDVVLEAADGSSQEEGIEDGGTLIPATGAGVYQLKVTAGEVTETAEVLVPVTGRVNIIFDLGAAEGERIQSESVAAVGEITVTARRFEETLQEVPIAISAFATEEIEVKQITDIQDAALATPNLWMEKNTGTSSGGRAAIRGVTEDESFFTSDTPVGIYIDDVYIPRQTGSNFDLYELERLEVLRGPQGTLYGRNTSAGAIKLITKKPGNRFQANFYATVGDFSRADFRGSVSSPIVQDKSAFQIAAMTKQHDGYDENRINGAEVNDQDIWGLRGSLQLFPSSSSDILIVADYLEERSTPGYGVGLTPQPPLNALGFGQGELDLNDDLDGDGDPHTLITDLLDPVNDLDQQGVSVTVNALLGENLLFKSVTAIREMENLLLLDADGQTTCFGLPVPCFHLFQDQEQEQFSQEFQVQGAGKDGDLTYVAGVYYFQEENKQRTENIIFAPLGANNFWDTSLDTDSIAIFGDGTYRAGDKFSISFGARWTNDEKDFDTIVFYPDGSQMQACVGPDGAVIASTEPCGPDDPAGSTTVPVENQLSDEWDSVTPRFVLDYAWTPEVRGYVSAARGFKSGAFDGRANNGASVLPLQPIAEEDVWSYELGLKSDWLENKLRLNVAAFLNDYDDLQGTGTDQTGNFRRFSVGDVETEGIELEAVLTPSLGLTLEGMFAVLDTKYTTVNFNQAVDCFLNATSDKVLELKASPPQSYRFAATYVAPSNWSGGASVSHKGEVFHQSCNAAAGLSESYELLAAFLAYEMANGHWKFTLAGKNLADEEYIAAQINIPGLRFISSYINPPREYTFTVRFSI
jgi:iron complex outermembrane receptor protein